MAKTQNDPVKRDEYVLRRIPNNPDWYVASLPIQIQRVAFAPNAKDTDGLSIFRELFVTPERVAHAGRNPAGYYVARLAVSKLLELGLSVVPDPRADEPPGHALIPEMSHAAAKNSKTKSREVQLQLAKLASSAIVYTPG